MLYNGIVLDKFQEDSIKYINEDRSVLICAPTGSGKTLIAEYSIEQSLKRGKKAIYTAPIKALNNQKFRDFRRIYGNKVGLKTGDVTINPNAQILLMTTEIFRNTVFESEDSLKDVDYAILDEIHYLDDIERGTVWEECIIFAPLHIKFICLSATVSNYNDIIRWFNKVRQPDKLYLVLDNERKVPLNYYLVTKYNGVKLVRPGESSGLHSEPREQALGHGYTFADLIAHLVETQKLPAIYFSFSRKECESRARSVKIPVIEQSDSEYLSARYDELCSGYAIRDTHLMNEIRRLLKNGVCYHHAGVLPAMKEIIEQLFSSGLIKILFATETFAVGVNMPARSVVFNSIDKFNGKRNVLLTPREFHQMAGRAGRRGIDSEGFVYAVAMPNQVRDFREKILNATVNPIRSQFNLAYSTILTLYNALKGKIYFACRNSLANFTENGRSNVEWKTRQLERKIKLLTQLGYIRDSRLTTKGILASKIYGYEIPLVELHESLDINSMGVEQICCLMLAICYEAKKNTFSKRPHQKWFYSLQKRACSVINRLIALERRQGIRSETKPLEFGLSSVMLSWIKSPDINKIQELTTADPGDIVRYFRLTIQIIRNFRYAIDDERLQKKLEQCLELIDRNEVDAEAQILAPLQDSGGIKMLSGNETDI